MIDDIQIECRDASHDGRIVKIERMVHDARGWTPMGAVTTKARRDAETEAEATGMSRVAPRRTKTGYRPTDDGHEKFNWKCALCGSEVRVRAEKLHPILDTLAAAGLKSVTVEALHRLIPG